MTKNGLAHEIPDSPGVVADYGRKYDSAVACFMDDFEACIAHPSPGDPHDESA